MPYFGGWVEIKVSFGTVYVTDANIPSRCFEGFAEEASIGQGVLHDRSKAIKAKMDQVVVLSMALAPGRSLVQDRNLFARAVSTYLGNDLGAWPGEIKSVRLLGWVERSVHDIREGLRIPTSTQVVQLEDQVLRQVRFITPDDPANTGIDQAKFVA